MRVERHRNRFLKEVVDDLSLHVFKVGWIGSQDISPWCDACRQAAVSD